MKKIITLLFAALVCFASCGSSSSEDEPEPAPTPTPNPTPDNPTGTVAFLTATEFAASQWGGKNDNGDISLIVAAADMTLNYYDKTTLSKNTNEPVLKTVKITYTFDEAKGTFTGKGDDGAQYSGSLTSKTAMTFKMPTADVALTKK